MNNPSDKQSQPERKPGKRANYEMFRGKLGPTLARLPRAVFIRTSEIDKFPKRKP